MWDSPIQLVENHRRSIPPQLKGKLAGLSQYLDEVWRTRTLFYNDDPEKSVSVQQPFLELGRIDGKGQVTMKAGRYAGFIQYEGVTIHILPKLFSQNQPDAAFRHILWWLDYSQRVRFPFSDLLTGNETIDNFPEALIRYFARFVHRVMSDSPYHQYEEVTETMPYLRGRLNIQSYVNTSLSRGNWHQLICDHEPFQFNNRLNQIIKFVTRKLGHLCRSETLPDLDRLLFLLDGVDDVPCTVRDCDTVQLNRFFQEYKHCLDMCRFFLNDQYLNRQNDQQRHFCFLVPMDMVYEDFIAGVVKTELSNQFRVQTQAESHLATTWPEGEKTFKIKNDLLLTDRHTRAHLVVDTKYKVRKYESGDQKAGISQTDIYQMVSYGLRRDTRQVVLLYPRPYDPAASQERTDIPQTQPDTFTVNSGLMNNQPIHVKAVDLTVTGQNKQALVSALVDQLEEAFQVSRDAGVDSAPKEG